MRSAISLSSAVAVAITVTGFPESRPKRYARSDLPLRAPPVTKTNPIRNRSRESRGRRGRKRAFACASPSPCPPARSARQERRARSQRGAERRGGFPLSVSGVHDHDRGSLARGAGRRLERHLARFQLRTGTTAVPDPFIWITLTWAR